MNLRLKRTHQVGVALALAVAIAATLALRPSGALATAPVGIVPFDDPRLSAKLQELAVRVAGREGVETATLVAVAPSGAQDAGVFVGSDASGADVVAPYNADGMMGFASVDRVAAYGGVMVFPSAAGEAGVVRRVSLVGLAEPRVAEVTITLADGSSLRAELVRAGRRGFRFFAYATDASSRFPVSYRAHGADGKGIKSEDVAQALTPPAGGVG